MTKDYELIGILNNKFPTRVTVGFFNLGKPICLSYRKYSPAYFEEIILDPQTIVEERAAHNFRERFLISSESIY